MLTIYSQPNCPHCLQAKEFLDNLAIDYIEVNIRANPEALAFVKDRGHKSVPQLYVGEQLLVEGGNSGLQELSPADIRARIALLNSTR